MSNSGNPHDPQNSQKPSGNNKTAIIVGGVLGAVAIVVLGCCCGGYYLINRVSESVRGFGAEAGRAAANAAVEASDFSDDDKAEITEQVNRVADGYKAGDIEMQQAMDVMLKLSSSPLFALGTLRTVQERFVKPSGLGQAEKDDAILTIGRVSRGIVEKTISKFELDALNKKHLMIVEEVRNEFDDDVDGENVRQVRHFKNSITDDELKDYLVELKQLADDASIPEEPYEPDVGGEFKRIVDEAIEK